MNNFRTYAYLIECQSNLHVGSGDNNYGVIDKQVQRDTITNTPIIHASGLKGALREYFEECIKLDKAKIRILFGSDKDEQEEKEINNKEDKKDEVKGKKFVQGALRFFEARLISIPVRGQGKDAFYRATSTDLIDDFNTQALLFKVIDESKKISTKTKDETGNTEYGEFPYLTSTDTVGENAIDMGTKLNEEVLTHLPIIARNSLENGQSENLWYEEIVPRESRFYFFVAVPEKEVSNFITDFHDNLHEKIVQIGANATVGYGYCKITHIS